MKTQLAAALSALTIAVPAGQAVAATRSAGTATATKVVTRKLVGTTATAGRWGSVKTIVTAKITTKNGKKTIRYTDLGGQLQLPHEPLAIHHVAVAPDAPPGVPERPEREHPGRLRRDRHEPGVRAVLQSALLKLSK